ncbi:hypothetical protein XOC_4594 [Xanthomonas oryzae pv. oryzicola BLS256]|uniref:Uncharacterized protein n=1 Tax=Xanthomonas oryzae pv. oryzicola (strain BLS256) TaxID=383407 RepID=G7TC38_XANOB|nr:hypothetical protein XOC_4594 [Xanthomonas oryzae pv. oryzicola BLS256]QEO95101.1 hypothetical protein XOCgx_0105 [Xanthomonas oryzae pv. oryzicola]
MRDAMTLAINPRMRRLLSIVFWMATCVSCSAGVEILFAALWVFAASTCRDVCDTDIA